LFTSQSGNGNTSMIQTCFFNPHLKRKGLAESR